MILEEALVVESIERGRSRSSVMMDRVRLPSSPVGLVGAAIVLAMGMYVLEENAWGCIMKSHAAFRSGRQ